MGKFLMRAHTWIHAHHHRHHVPRALLYMHVRTVRGFLNHACMNQTHTYIEMIYAICIFNKHAWYYAHQI